MDPLGFNTTTLATLEDLAAHPADVLPVLLQQLDPKGNWDKLTQKVSSVQLTSGAEWKLPLLGDAKGSKDFASGKWTWTVSGEANADLSIDVQSPEEAKALAMHADDGHSVIIYGCNLGLGATLGGKAAFNAWGKASLNAQGSVSDTLSWYVQADGSKTLIEALVAAQSQFTGPHDIGAMLRMANRGNWLGLDAKIAGKASVAGSAELGAKGSAWTVSIDGKEASVGISLGVKAGFSYSKESDWLLTARVAPEPGGLAGSPLGVRIKLHDDRKSSRSVTASLAATIDTSAVVSSAEDALKAAWPDLSGNKLLQRLIQPGTAISDSVRKLINDKLKGDLASLALALTGDDQAGAALGTSLVDRLTGGLTHALDDAAAAIADGTATAKSVEQIWLANIFGSSALAGATDAKVTGVVDKALKGASDALTDGVDELKKSITGKAEDVVDGVVGKLGEFGAQFDKKLKALDDNAASKAIKDALTRYTAVRKKFLDALSSAAKKKISLTFASEATRKTEDEAFFEVWFRAGDAPIAEAARLYAAICTGQMQSLFELVADATAADAIKDAKGTVMSAIENARKDSVTLDFFGIQIGSSSTWLSKVKFTSDVVTGDLKGSASASVDTSITNPWKNRSANLGVQFKIDSKGGATSVSATLNGAFTAKKEDSNPKNAQALLDDYASALGSPQFDLAGTFAGQFDAQKADAFWKQLTLALPVALTSVQWNTFAQCDPARVASVALDVALVQFRRSFLGSSLFSDDPLAMLRGQVREFREHDVGRFPPVTAVDDDLILDYLQRFPKGTAFNADSDARSIAIDATADSKSPGLRMFHAWHRLAVTVRAPIRLQASARAIDSMVNAIHQPVDPSGLAKAFDPVMKEVRDALAPVALVSETWTAKGWGGAPDEPISWPFVSFIAAMGELAGITDVPAFPPIAQAGDKPAVRLLRQ